MYFKVSGIGQECGGQEDVEFTVQRRNKHTSGYVALRSVSLGWYEGDMGPVQLSVEATRELISALQKAVEEIEREI